MRRRLFRFFYPPEGSSWPRRYIPWMMVLAVPVMILLITPAAWEYSNSPKFCGTTCHTMPPEYQTYQVSPHARVLCVDCHIGRDSVFTQAYRKSAHMTLLYKTAVGDYEYPIRAGELRPARDTCERCHYPQKFSDDSLRVMYRYDDDEDNSPYAVYLLMHTGGGSQREGLGRGIHWHIENPIEYIALDPELQEIPWIRVNTAEGETIEYLAEDADIDLDNLAQYKIHEMDCITCHNRISHLIEPPRDVVDAALYRSDISAAIPFIRAQAVSVLTPRYESEDEAAAAITALIDFYRTEYPEFYADNAESVQSAVDLLIDLHAENTFHVQELDWMTHPNNIGHRDSPGCFRCHDGKHFAIETGEAIRLECNLCHAIPQVVHPGEISPSLPLSTGIEPSSHLDSTWISRHHNEINQSCANCHTMANPGGTTDESFCSNSACHGVDWEYAGFDALTLAAELGLEPQTVEPETEITVETGETITYQQLQPVFVEKCGACHGANPSKGLKVTDYESLMAGSADGPVVVPGEPEESDLLTVLKAGHFGQFTAEQMVWVEQWIAEGAPEGEAAVDEADADADTTEVQAPPALDQESKQPITYETIQVILTDNCGTCHGAGAIKGLNVTTYEALMAGSDDGPVIVPGEPDESDILAVLEAGHFGQLTDEQMAWLEQWIVEGALESESDSDDAG